jgi:valyl-tRNA synthetase
MEKKYNHKEKERQIIDIWEKGDYFTPKIDQTKRSFSIFLTPPNASGEMHVGNAFMIAMQDILARYHRAKGEPTLWIPGTDHGGYETQVTFEKELEKIGADKSDYKRKDLFKEIEKFVANNNETIKNQIKALGGSVDWSRFRFTMDKSSLESVNQTFRNMVHDNIIYRRPYMVYYCPKCATILSDIELKEKEEVTQLYFVKFFLQGGHEYLSLATTRPEFLFATTHVLVHPFDKKHAPYIGKILINPITNQPVEIVESKRKLNPEKIEPFLTPFSPSYKKYDYEYTLKNSIPSRNLVSWEGKMLERYPGQTPLEAREKELQYLKKNNLIEKIDSSYVDSSFLCKKGHDVESIIMLTWFLKLDDEKTPLRKPAYEAAKGLTVMPKWKKDGLLEWLGKMPDWPIARQNVWGIKIPIWYDVSDPSQFTVWFRDKNGQKQNGNLKDFLDDGLTLEEIQNGLERIYASENAPWTLEKIPGKTYLPETDTFDTWFSSGQWATIAYKPQELSYFYPSHSIVIGLDLLRLSVSRKILLSQYLTGKLPFKIVYLHHLIKGQDGQKMSKSLGNSVSLEYYLEKFGADVTRMALVSYTNLTEDFIFSEDQLNLFKDFSERLWKMGRVVNLANEYSVKPLESANLSNDDKNLILEIDNLVFPISSYIEKYFFASAQENACKFIFELEKYVEKMQTLKNIAVPLSVLFAVFKKYLMLLHPFMPFMTEELYQILYKPESPLATNPWPKKNP